MTTRKTRIFLYLLVIAIVCMGCDVRRPKVRKGQPLSNPGAFKNTAVEEKKAPSPQGGSVNDQGDDQAEESFNPTEFADCVVKTTQRPVRLLNRGFDGFFIMADCEDIGTVRVYFLDSDIGKLFDIGKGTKISVANGKRNGEKFWRFSMINSDRITQKRSPGGVEDFNELMINMPTAKGETVNCMPNGHIQAMTIGQDALLRTHVGDDVQDNYYYVDCWGRSWPGEGVMVFYKKGTEIHPPKGGERMRILLTGTYGVRSFMTGEYQEN